MKISSTGRIWTVSPEIRNLLERVAHFAVRTRATLEPYEGKSTVSLLANRFGMRKFVENTAQSWLSLRETEMPTDYLLWADGGFNL